MSLTLPTAYSTSSKLGNIQENWIVQLGFYNGDAHGSGEGGWDATLQADGTANLLNEALDDSETAIDVDDGTVFQVGDYIKVESEIMKVKSISSNTLTVDRGAMSTTAATHNNNTAIYWNNFTPISLADTTIDSVFYHGTITNKPSIRSSIDLATSKAKTGNVSLSVINFQYKGDDFSAELFLGTRKYINRDVKIYSQLNGDTALANCLQIYQGRLIDISHDDSSISLQLTEQRPWDFITIPNARTVKANNDRGTNLYFPVAYGNFSANVSTGSAPALCYPEVSGQSANLFPIPVHKYDTTEFFCLMPGADTGNSSNNANSCTPHFYEKNIDSFIPTLNSSGNTYMDNTDSYQGGNAVKAPLDLFRSFRFKPEVLGSGNEFTTNPYNAFDTASGAGSTAINTDTTAAFTTLTYSPTGGSASSSTSNLDAIYNVPQIDGKVTLVKLAFGGYSLVNGSASAGTLSVAMKYNKLDDSAYITMATNSTSGTSSQSLGLDGSTAGVATHTTADIVSQLTAGKMPSTVEVRYTCTFDYGNLNDGKTPNIISGFLSDVQFIVQTKLAFDTDNISGSIAKLDAVKILYTGGDGLASSYSGGSGVAGTGLDAHRDMLYRFTGWDDTDANIYNWSSGLDVHDKRIDTATWNIAWWALEPVELKKVLEQIQYEFGFIFKLRHDGSGSYWLVKDSYSSGDVVQTLKKEDIKNLKINNTPFSELLTKMDIQYKRHPAETSKYLLNVTSEDTTNNPRTDWNIQAKENIKEVKLDMNIDKPGNANPGGGDPNDGFADYYMNIFGTVKKIISCEIVNPAVSYNLETGDIIQFSNTAGDMPVEPFGDNWDDYYMIIDLKRSPGKVSITVREVG
ncbi:MAG: hypothetical protein CMB80_00155 [Flammeovirgaceae bacterium]|nr:hypothetical protein [Flammeovirgaceae bacterium]